MIRLITIFLGLSLIAFISYLFLSNNIALAIIVSMGSLIFVPLAIKGIKGGLYLGSVSHGSFTATSGGTSGGVGASSGGSSGGCGGGGC